MAICTHCGIRRWDWATGICELLVIAKELVAGMACVIHHI